MSQAGHAGSVGDDIETGGTSDTDAIRRTMARYCHAVDDGRFDDLVELFTPEALYLAPGDRGLVGRADIRAFLEKAQPPERRGKHVGFNAVIEVDGDTATSTSDFVFLSRNGGRGWSVAVVGRYYDRFARQADDWLFSERSISLR
ncbi:MAG: nuclear transport factor 2 family protein [Acidimicrobiales bacterium]